MSDSPDLSTVTLDEIVAELERRYDGLLILAETDRTADAMHTSMHYRGGSSRVIGMAERFKWRMVGQELRLPDESEGG